MTGDFFGTLDYLPRKLFFRDFITYIVSLNSEVKTPCLDDVDWDNAEILFWPRTYTDEENAEPDVVIVTNKWLLVVEVKLMSGLGDTQPWREYVIGRKIAADYSISLDAVYYLIVARKRLDISRLFKPNQSEQCNELLSRTSYLKWHEAFFLVDSWLRVGIGAQKISAEHHRMLYDLFQAMRKRRAIAFSGFSFANTGAVSLATGRIFCPPRFTGFLYNLQENRLLDDYIFLRQEYSGFGSLCPEVYANDSFVFLENTFEGFVERLPKVTSPSDYLFCPPKFSGFSGPVPICKTYKNVFLKD